MKLRTRLALTLGLATVSVLVLLGWAQSRWQSRLRVEALAEAAVHRMESGGRERCEANPDRWPRPRRGWRDRRGGAPGPRVFRRPELFAYDSSFESRNPDSPPFPPELARRIEAGEGVAAERGRGRRPTQVAVRMGWDEGACAVVLMRTKGPPPLLSRAVLLPALLVALVVIAVALLAAGPIVGRVRRLTGSVRRLADGADEPIAVEGSDEIGELGEAFEQSRRTIQAQIGSLRERELALRNYIANTTHDVMLPLSVLQGHLTALQQKIEAGDPLDASAVAPSIEEAQYLGSLLHNLNASARLEAHAGLTNRDTLDLNRLVERVVDRHRPIARRKQVALEVAVPERTVELEGDLTLLEQAFGNVIQNAIRYNQAGGHVAVVLEGSDDAWTLDVVDDGPGIPASELARAMEPSFRGNDARTRHPHGMGLGLHIASDVAERHGLALRLVNTEGGGLKVRFTHSPGEPARAGLDT